MTTTADTPALAADLDAQAARDIAELTAAAREYEDSAEACDTPGLAAFRLRRRTRARALRAIAERVAQLVVAARAGMEDTARLEALIADIEQDVAPRHRAGIEQPSSFWLAREYGGIVAEIRARITAARAGRPTEANDA